MNGDSLRFLFCWRRKFSQVSSRQQRLLAKQVHSECGVGWPRVGSSPRSLGPWPCILQTRWSLSCFSPCFYPFLPIFPPCFAHLGAFALTQVFVLAIPFSGFTRYRWHHWVTCSDGDGSCFSSSCSGLPAYLLYHHVTSNHISGSENVIQEVIQPTIVPKSSRNTSIF